MKLKSSQTMSDKTFKSDFFFFDQKTIEIFQ